MDDLLIRMQLQTLARGRPPGYLHLLNRLLTSSRDLNFGSCPLLHGAFPPYRAAIPLVFLPCPLQPVITCPLILRGRAMELAAWDPGVHPQESIWFPCMNAWLILRRDQRLRVVSGCDPRNFSWLNG